MGFKLKEKKGYSGISLIYGQASRLLKQERGGGASFIENWRFITLLQSFVNPLQIKGIIVLLI